MGERVSVGSASAGFTGGVTFSACVSFNSA